MRVDNVTYAAFLRSEAKDVRYVISINFGDDANPRMHYFTSHTDCAVSATATAVSYDVIESISSRAQRLDLLRSRSDIGGVRFSVIDPLGAVTTVITGQLSAGYSLRQKEVVIYLGGKGFVWSDYVTAATVIIDDREWSNGVHTFNCSDILRTTRKNIFDLNVTNLRNSITQDDTVLTVYNTSKFEFNTHGNSYSDAPGLRVIYIDVDNETIRTTDKVDTPISVTGTDISINSANNSINSITTNFSGFSQGMQIVLSGDNDGIYHIAQPPTATKIITAENLTNTAAGSSINVLADIQFYNCTRGVLNTKPAAHDVDATADADQRTKVTERVYFELPLLKAAYAILTGNVYGQADPFPNNWHLNISTKWVATSTFTIHPDWWDIADDVTGQLVRFNGLKKRDGKKFVEEQLMRLQGAFMRVQSDGQLALRRKTRVSEKAAHVRVLDDSNLIEWGTLKEDMTAVYDAFTFNWNADPKTGKPNRHITLLNPDSNNVQGKPKTLEMTFEGLSGYTTTQATLSLLRDSTRDMYAGSPFLCQVKALPSMNDLEIGDVIRWRTPSVRDPINDSTLDRSFIIIGKNDDWMTGGVVLDLFGSSSQATPVNDAQSNRVLPNSAYEVGVELLNYLNSTYVNANGTKYQIVNGVLNIIGSIDLTGNDDLSLGGNYYYHGDVTINQLDSSSNQIVVTINKNGGLWINGHFTNNGIIDGIGRGIDNGSVGFIGVTKAGGGFNHKEILGYGTSESIDTDIIAAENYSIPNFNIQWDGSKLLGLPNSLMGTGGGQGANTTYFSEDDLEFTKGPYTAQGGSYGGGGSGLLIVAHSLSMGVSAGINLSGGDGQPGEYVTSLGNGGIANGSFGYNAGSAGGGAGGALLVVLDGSGAFETGLSNGFISANGDSPIFGGRLISKSGKSPWRPEYANGINSYYAGYQASDSSDANYRVQYLMDNIAPSPEPPEYSDRPLTINVQEQVSSSNTLNQSGLEISVNPPSDPTYRGARLSISKVPNNSWSIIGDVYNTEELVHTVLADGSSYKIRAQAISINGSVSSEYVETVWTVTIAAGVAVIGSGNVIQSSPTVGQPINGQGIIHGAESISGYNQIGQEKTRIDAVTGKITAVDVNLTGSITALSGQIGGWDITSASFKAGNNATRMEFSPATGIWFGANSIGAAPFSITPAGALKSESGSIGGWSITSTLINDSTGNFVLDSANTRLRLKSGSNKIDLSPNGITATDSVLGTTFNLPTNGDAPTFSSGVINSTVFNITSAGILETSANVGNGGANGQGVRINDLGVIAYAANDPTPKVILDSATGLLTAVNANISGQITIGSGSSGISAFDDAGSLATQNTVDWQNDISGNGIPADNADVTASSAIGKLIIPAGMNIGGYGDIRFTKNMVVGGALNPGEVRVQGTVFYHPDGNKREFTNPDKEIYTPYEGSVKQNPFFIMYTEEAPSIRFGGGLWGSWDINYCLVIYDAANNQWKAVDNGNQKTDFVPLNTDCLVAKGLKISNTGGIDSLVSLLGVNTNMPEDNADVTGDKISVGSGLLYNWDLTVINSAGKPAGIRGVEGINDQSGIKFGDSNNNFVRLGHDTNTSFAYGFPAIQIDDKKKYKITIRHRSSAVTTTGLYLRINEIDNFLPQNKTHIGQINGESITAIRSSFVDLVSNGPMPDIAWIEKEYTYTPTIGTRFASFSVYKWLTGFAHTYDVDSVIIEPLNLMQEGVTITGGGITLSDGGNIKGGQTSYSVGSGFFIGYEANEYKSSLGNTISYNRWTGSEIEIRSGDINVKGIDFNPGGDNEIHFYGDRGDGITEEIGRIGTTVVGNDTTIITGGSFSVGSSNVGILGQSNSNVGVKGRSASNIAVDGYSVNSTGVSGSSTDGSGVVGQSANGYGGVFVVGPSAPAPIRIYPSSSPNPPTHVAAKGSLWVTFNGVQYMNTNGSTTWVKTGAQ